MSQDYDFLTHTLSGKSPAQSFPEIQELFQAVLSSNLGTTAPTTTFPGMPWFDSNAGALKIRNQADDGWVTLFTFGGAAGAKAPDATTLSGYTHNDICPVGGIIMYEGTTVALSSKWALCDGANGTPDLRNRFVIGAGGAYAVAATGGATSVNTGSSATGVSTQGANANVSVNNTTLSLSQSPPHNHGGSTGGNTSNPQLFSHDGGNSNTFTPAVSPGSIQESRSWTSSNIRDASNHGHSIGSAGGGGGHSHGVSQTNHTHGISDPGHNHSVSTMSPYYALGFIKRLA